MVYRLVIGNKNTSSWSLRPWLALRRARIAFTEVNIDLRDRDAKAQVLRHSPSGKVPALLVGSQVIWDSLAIMEYLAEAHPEARVWPAPQNARGHARSVAAEMHSGFKPLRDNCPMDFTARTPKARLPQDVAADVRRIVAIWRDCRDQYAKGGPLMFGRFCAADAMYAPVASRFRTYLPDLSAYGDDGTAQAYVEALFATPEMGEWGEAARQETEATARPRARR